MKLKSYLFAITCQILLLLVLSACEKKIGVEVFSGTNECQPPCWMEIRPGETSITEAKTWLDGFTRNGKATLTPLEDGNYWFRTISNEGITIHSDSTGLITVLEFDYRPSSIKLEDVIQIFGNPQYIDIGKVRDSYFDVLFYFPEKGLTFVAGGIRNTVLQDDGGFNISPKMIVFKGVYYRPTNFDGMMVLMYGATATPIGKQEIQNWKGYGKYFE